jgi:elongator complex protein 3
VLFLISLQKDFCSIDPCGGFSLYSLLRLRLPNLEPLNVSLFPELAGCAIIREIHTYGKTLGHKDKQTKKTQHQGLGKRLMQEAENIALATGYKKIAVISSIGTREYYRSLGYVRVGLYMVKDLTKKG